MKIEKVGLFGKFNDSSVSETLDAVRKIIEQQGLSVLIAETTAPSVQGPRIDTSQPVEEQIDLGIVVGGDGTMLNAARMLAEHDLPAIGVNLGRLGFLTDITVDDFDTALQSIRQGRYRKELRTLLRTTVLRDGETVYTGVSLNDAVISKGNSGRLIEFETRVNGQFVSHTRSDGVIVATPTGSTAYSLSAGGPIIYPNLSVFSMAPICPHTLSNRPIVLDEDAVIEISELYCPEVHANLVLDGVLTCELNGTETVRLEKSLKKLCLIRIESHNHFETLHDKLGWNG
ncbi:MAG: NAD(+)/NADH kinase [Pseudomonadota bacterium]